MRERVMHHCFRHITLIFSSIFTKTIISIHPTNNNKLFHGICVLALESSLWELTALERHYHPAISTLAKSIGTENDKTTPLYDMEDFLVHTYKSLFEQEKKKLGSGGGGGGTSSGGSGGGRKRGGSRVALTFVEPKGLFTEDDVFAGIFKCA